jgi:hypothetical protein
MRLVKFFVIALVALAAFLSGEYDLQDSPAIKAHLDITSLC